MKRYKRWRNRFTYEVAEIIKKNSSIAELAAEYVVRCKSNSTHITCANFRLYLYFSNEHAHAKKRWGVDKKAIAGLLQRILRRERKTLENGKV